MINSISTIISENPVQELWKLLRFFKDTNYCVKYHCLHLGISEEGYKQNKGNIEKQAKQIGYCIRQAEEYFKASAQVGLATRPNLLYYGAVSLSKALILLRKDGKHSVDYLRRKEKHQHHGLILKRAFIDANESIDVKDFFEKLECDCYRQEKTDKRTAEKSKIPWGHFSLFYESLISNAVIIKGKFIQTDKPGSATTEQVFDTCNLLPINTFFDKPFNSLSILKTLPDMCSQLARFDIQSMLCRGTIYFTQTDLCSTNEQGERVRLESRHIYNFFINNIPDDLKKDFVVLYRQFTEPYELIEDIKEYLLFKSTIIFDEYRKRQYVEIPDMVDDISGQIFYISNPNEYLPEPAAYIILLFNLGMVCRYYPDVWLRIIDNNVPIAEITDSLLNIVYRKFPNLILDLMTNTKHYIHS